MTLSYIHLEFEWDPEKAELNAQKHGVLFTEATSLWRGQSVLEFYDYQSSTEEDRWLKIGFSNAGRPLVVSYCERENPYRIRLISARRASKQEITMMEER